MNVNVQEKFRIYYELTFEYLQSDLVKALYYINEAERSALLSADSLLVVKSKRVESQILYLLKEPYEAIRVVEPLLKWDLSRMDKYECHAIFDHLGLCHGLIGQFDRSLHLHFEALEVGENLNDPERLSTSLRNIGFTYYKLKDYRKALQYILKSEVGNRSSKFTLSSFVNLSLAYSHLHQFDSAEIYLKRHEQLCGEGCSEEDRMHRSYASGVLHYGRGSFKEAEYEFLNSLNLARRLKDSRIQLDNIYLLSKISLQSNRPALAARFLTAGEALIRTDFPFNIEMIKLFSELSALNLAIKNYPKAAEYQAKYIVLKDSIYNESVTNRLIEIESHFLERRNKARIQEQEHIIFLNGEIIRRQQMLNLLSVVIVVLTIIVISYLIRSYRRKQAMSILLDQKVRERTSELESTREELITYIREKEALFNRSLSGIQVKIRTLRGLCDTAHIEVSDPIARAYLERIHSTSNEVDRELKAESGNYCV